MQTLRFLMAGALALAFAGTVSAAPARQDAAHEHQHEPTAGAATLHLNAGKKWETDAPLRQAMGNIRQAMAASLPGIHENRLSAKGYGQLARKLEGEVSSIVAHCKLEPQADRQLHLILSQLLEGTQGMASRTDSAKRQAGAVRVIGALEKYATYFDDGGFEPIAH